MDLTKEQKDIIRENVGKITDLSELTRLVFPDSENLDGRSKQGRAVRKFLADNAIDYQTRHFSSKDPISLNEEQKDFIDKSISDGMDCAQIAAILFPEARITKVGYNADDKKRDPKAYAKLPACCKDGGHDKGH